MKKVTYFVAFLIAGFILFLALGLEAQKNPLDVKKLPQRLLDKIDDKLATLAAAANISNSASQSGYPKLGVDQNGAAYLSWIEWLNTKTFYFSTNRLGSWASPQSVEAIVYNAEEAGYPTMAVSKSGSCYLTFQDGRVISYDIFLKSYENYSWASGAANVSNNDGGSAYSGCAVSPADNYLYVVWQDGTVTTWQGFFRYRSPSGSWSSTSTLPVYGNVYMPQIAIDGSGTAHVVWMARDGASVRYARNPDPKNPSGWRDEAVVKMPTNTEWAWPKIAVDTAGNAYVVWLDGTTGNQQVFFRRRTADGAWHEVMNASGTSGFADEADIAVNRSQLAVYIAWSEGGEIYMNSYAGGSWSGAVNYSATSGNSIMPSVAVDYSGKIHLAWADNTSGNYDIYYLGSGSPPPPPPPPPPPDPTPHPPVGLAVETKMNDAGTAKINTLTWYKNPQDSSLTISKFEVYRKPMGHADSEFALVAGVSGSTFRYDDANLPFNTKFTYGMLAIASNGKVSDPSDFVDEQRIFAPLSLSLKTVTNSSMFQSEKINVLTWSENPLNQGVTIVKYNVWRKKVDEENSSWKVIGSVAAGTLEYKDRKLSTKDKFNYGITAVDSEGYESRGSNIVQEGN